MYVVAICVRMYVYGMWQYLRIKRLVNCHIRSDVHMSAPLQRQRSSNTKFTGNPLTFHYLVAIVDYSCYYFYFWTLTGRVVVGCAVFLDVAIYLLSLPLQPPLIKVGLFYFRCWCCWNSKLHNGSERRRRKFSYRFTVNSSCICFGARGEKGK